MEFGGKTWIALAALAAGVYVVVAAANSDDGLSGVVAGAFEDFVPEAVQSGPTDDQGDAALIGTAVRAFSTIKKVTGL